MADHSGTTRERRTAYFIIAVMVLALLWFAGQAGWFSAGSDERADVAPPPSPAKQIDQRRGLCLPVGRLADLRDRLDASAAGKLHENGVNWLMLRLPVWTPTPRRFEYNSFELEHLSEIVETAHAAGMGVTLAPVYWDGSALSTIPPVPVNATLFGYYRDMLLDLAGVAAESGADALQLDGLFGSTAVSAVEWTDLLGELRARFSGAIEGRIDEGHTPAMYLTQLDAAALAPADTTAPDISGDLFAALREKHVNKALLLIMPDPDRYHSNGMAWDPICTPRSDDDLALEFLSLPALIEGESSGFFLCGADAFEILSHSVDADAPLARRLRAIRDASVRKALEDGRREHSITQ